MAAGSSQRISRLMRCYVICPGSIINVAMVSTRLSSEPAAAVVVRRRCAVGVLLVDVPGSQSIDSRLRRSIAQCAFPLPGEALLSARIVTDGGIMDGC